MTTLRRLVLALFAALAIYTLMTVSTHGPNFVPGFTADLLSLSWRGQVNLDLITFTTLAGLWVAWRHKFSTGGVMMGLLVFLGAMLLFAPYLLYATGKARGDFAVLLLGEHRPRP